MTKTAEKYDVAIIGAGLAGSLLARHLRRTLPDLSILQVEKAQRPSFKVGESTVEIASSYLLRRVGLSRYLYEHHLPKNGLRFFFDTPERDAELEAMSEMGSDGLPHLPSFQIDRARFETDLRAMNAADGIELRQGRVKSLQLDGAGGHRFDVLDPEGGRQPIEARWVLDASGRAGVIARSQDLWRPLDHAIAAVWGRFTGVKDLDDYGSEAFRARVRHTSRVLSTNHFCYPGYWIWFIPLGEGVTSVGVVIDREQWEDGWRRPEGFQRFLREHRAVADLLEGAELVDVMSYKQLAYAGERYLGDRWACVGESAAFSDPLYSPGSDFIALENDFVVDLIRRDLAGEDIEPMRARYDAFLKFRYDATLLLYQDLYRTLGSFELFHLKWDFDISCYYDLWLEPYLRDDHLDARWLDGQLRQKDLVLNVLARFRDLFLKVHEHLASDDALARKNCGEFVADFPAIGRARQLGSDASARAALRRTADAFNRTRNAALALLGDEAPGGELTMRHFLSGKALV